MGDRDKDLDRVPNPVDGDTQGGTTNERDFGKSDRYANKDDEQEFNVRMTGDGTSWDTGRESSIGHGTGDASRPRAADAEAPGVPTQPASPSDEESR